MANILETILVKISRNLDVMKNVFIGPSGTPKEICLFKDLFKEFCDVSVWSYEEMLGIDPSIVEKSRKVV